MALGFDGVHLGQEDLQHSHADLKIVTAKKLLLGVSTHSLDEIDTALRLCTPDYVAIGPWNATPNKPYLAAPGHTALRACLQHLKTDHPQCLTVGIGGIHLMNAEQLFGYGLDILAGISLANELATADESRPDACL